MHPAVRTQGGGSAATGRDERGGRGERGSAAPWSAQVLEQALAQALEQALEQALAAVLRAQASKWRLSSREAWHAWRVLPGAPLIAACLGAPPAELGLLGLGLAGRGALGSSRPRAAGRGRSAACSMAAVAAVLRSMSKGA